MASHVLKFDLNVRGRDFFVGDIHGCFHLLEEAMSRVGFDVEVDRIFSVGDLVDRGPNSKACVDWISQPWFHAVQGNHEHMLLEYTHNSTTNYNPYYPYGMSQYDYSNNGGDWAIELGKHEQDEIAFALSCLPLALEVDTCVGRVGVIHAEVPGDDWETTANLNTDQWSSNQAVWSRQKIRQGDTKSVTNIDLVVVGHSVVDVAVRLGNVCYIDTGAVFGLNSDNLSYCEATSLTLVEACNLPMIPTTKELRAKGMSYGY
jgi:serine/threonine protein phosphatase 1